jgi:hypothetical protein
LVISIKVSTFLPNKKKKKKIKSQLANLKNINKPVGKSAKEPETVVDRKSYGLHINTFELI